MLGNPDTLMVDLGERYSQGSTVWSVSGDQGDQWKYEQVEIDATTVNGTCYNTTDNVCVDFHNCRYFVYTAELVKSDTRVFRHSVTSDTFP
jgi:hypothetical protein